MPILPNRHSLKAAQSSLQGPGSTSWTHKISQCPTVVKRGERATDLGHETRQEKRCSIKEWDSHPIKNNCLTCQTSLFPGKKLPSNLCGEDMWVHTLGTTHRNTLSLWKRRPCNGSSAPFYNRVKRFCTGESFLWKKKVWATSSTPINLSKATDKTEFGNSDEAIYNKLPFTCKSFYHYLVIAGKG